MSDTNRIRVTVVFTGRLAGAIGIDHEITTQVNITVPSPFTEEQAKEAARVSLYEKDLDRAAYEHVTVRRIMFN